MNKKLLTSLLAAGAMAAMAVGSAQAADVTLVMAEENSIDSLSGKVAQYFADQVAELTNGEVAIDLQCSKVLGSESEILEGMIAFAGTVDIERVTSSRFTNSGCTKAALLGLPYTFENRDHFWALSGSPALEEIYAELEEKLPITPLSLYEEGFRSFFFKDSVDDISGIAGKKIRVADDVIMQGIVNGLGGSPTVIASSELYTSLQSGVVDGAEQPLSPYQTNAFNEVAPYVILDEHTLGNAIYIISDLGKAKLSEDQLAAVKQAALNTQEYNKQIAAEVDEECMAALTEKGVTFVAVEDKAPYKEAVASTVADQSKGNEDLYQSILDLAK